MTIQAAIFDGSVYTTAEARVDYSRPHAITTAAGGTVAAAEAPHYADARVLCPAPAPITLDTDATALNQVFGGHWTDGATVACVHYRQKSSPNSAYVNIWVDPTIAANCFTGQPSSRSVNIRCSASGNKTTNQVDLLKGSPDEDAGWVYAPYGFTIVAGNVFGLCEAQAWTGSAWQAQAVGICKWDDTNGQWRLLLRGKTRNNGLSRGREWTTANYWPVDGLPLASSLEIFCCWADYGVNGSPTSDGGQLFIVRMSRASASDAWTIGTPIMLYEATTSGSHHFHNAAAYRPAGTASGVVITLCVGDSLSGEQVCFYRSDSSAYATGWDSGTKAMTASASDGATSNGWTTMRKVTGCPSTLSPPISTACSQWVGVCPLDGEAKTMVVSNDEKMNTVLLMHLPDPFIGETRAWFELMTTEVIPSPSIRRGRLALGMYCDGSSRTNYICLSQASSSATASVSPSFGAVIPVSWKPSANFLQGFSAAISEQNSRLLHAADGLSWGIMASPNANVRLAVVGNYAVAGGLSSFGKVVAYRFPTTISRRPLITSPSASQYQITSAASAEAASAGNTVAAVSAGSFGVADAIVTGRTIPAPPSNGPVIRWTVGTGSTSKYGGTRTLTTGTPMLISDRDPSGGATFQYMHVGFWVYQLPPSIPFGGDDVAPFNSPPTSFRIQLLRAGTGSASYAGAGDVDSVDGAGWVYYSVSTSTQQWAADIAANANVAMRLTDNATGANYMDALICFDSISLSASPVALPAHPQPVGAAATVAPTTIDADRCVVAGLACSSTWSLDLAAQIPDNSWDQYLPTAYLPANPVMCTIVEGPNRKIKISFDLANRRILVSDGTNTATLAPFSGEEFVFERGVPVLLSLSCNGTALEVSGSVGATQVSTASVTLALAVRPRSVHLADEALNPIAAMYWYGVSWDNSNTSDATARAAKLQNMSSTMAMPPGLPVAGRNGWGF
jgi:hypothetical protein